MERYVTLLGAEQVQSAARTISGAADQMSRAASQMEDTRRTFQSFLDDWLQQLRTTLEENRNG